MKSQGILSNLHNKLSSGTAFPMLQGLDNKGSMFIQQIKQNGPGALAPSARQKTPTANKLG
ncbi:MAG: hypothetical protein COB76_02770 [Alphaproteobacteria bacterium]|nr:MAG: hypothetical protein COB76_02770 [Alphaproteobacteria bacterium]